MVDVWAEDFQCTTFHCRSPRKMNLNKMDPSCCIGFYCNSKEDFYNLIETVEPVSFQLDVHSFLNVIFHFS